RRFKSAKGGGICWPKNFPLANLDHFNLDQKFTYTFLETRRSFLTDGDRTGTEACRRKFNSIHHLDRNMLQCMYFHVILHTMDPRKYRTTSNLGLIQRMKLS